MVRNGKVYGVLTTMKGWCFLRRVNGGGLYITRMFGDFAARPGVSSGAVFEGYYNTPNFTVMQAIYYLSSLAEATNDLPETPINGVPGQVDLPYAGNSTAAAPTIEQPEPPILPMPVGQGGYGYIGQGGYQGGYRGVQVLGGYDQAECSQYHSGVDYNVCNSNRGRRRIAWARRIGLPKSFRIKVRLFSSFGMHGSLMPRLEITRLLSTYISDDSGERIFHACALRLPSSISMP